MSKLRVAVWLYVSSVVLASIAAADACPVDSSGLLQVKSDTDMETAARLCTNVSDIRTMLVGAVDCLPTSVSGVQSLDRLEDLIAAIKPILHLECLVDLRSVRDLASVSKLSGLVVRHNPLLESIPGFNSLLEVDGQVVLSQNWRLRTLDGLKSLQRIGGFLSIERNPNITSLSGLSRLQRIDGNILSGDYALSLLENWRLTTLSGLRSLTMISRGTVRIEGNRVLCFAGYPQWSDEGRYKLRPLPLSVPADRGVDWRSMLTNTSRWLWRWGSESIPTLVIRNNAPWDKCATLHCSDACSAGAGCWGPSPVQMCGFCRNDSLANTCADFDKRASSSSSPGKSTYWPPPWEMPGVVIFIIVMTFIIFVFLAFIVFCYKQHKRQHSKKNAFKVTHNTSTTQLVPDYRQNSLVDEVNAIHMHSMVRQSAYGNEDDLAVNGFLPDEELVRKVEGGETVLDENSVSFSGFAGVKVGGIQYNYPRDQLRPLGKELGSSKLWRVYEAEAKRIISGLKRTKIVVLELKADAVEKDEEELLSHIEPMKLAHPNLLSVMGLCLERPPLLALCEASGQGDLKTYLIQHRWDSRSLFRHGQTLQMATNIAAGLSCLHSTGIVHRDFAARNCQVTANHIVKVGDYGLSQNAFPEDYYKHRDIEQALPVRWMAPSQFTPRDGQLLLNETTAEDNIWSFGVVLWELLSFGDQPQASSSDDEVLQLLLANPVLYKLDNPIQPGSALSSEEAPLELLPVVTRCLSPLAEDRPSSADLAEELNTLRRLAKEREAVSSPSPSIVPKTSRQLSVSPDPSPTNTEPPKQPVAVSANKAGKGKTGPVPNRQSMASVDTSTGNDSPVRSALRKAEESVQTKKRVDFKSGEQLTEVLNISALSLRSLEDKEDPSRALGVDGQVAGEDGFVSQPATSQGSVPVTDIDTAIGDLQTVPDGPAKVYMDTLQRSKKRKKANGQAASGSGVELQAVDAKDVRKRQIKDGQSQESVLAAAQAKLDPANTKLSAMMW